VLEVVVQVEQAWGLCPICLTCPGLLASIGPGGPRSACRLRKSDWEIWRFLATALADTPALSAETARLRAELAGARLDRANLAAAALGAL